MSIHRIGKWRTGDHGPGLVLEIQTYDVERDRVGHCWMKGRLRAGDIIMCMQHAGDCFWQYAILECVATYPGHKYRLVRESTFGAYTLGAPTAWQPSEQDFHNLMAGNSVTILESLRAPSAEEAGQMAALMLAPKAEA